VRALRRVGRYAVAVVAMFDRAALAVVTVGGRAAALFDLAALAPLALALAAAVAAADQAEAEQHDDGEIPRARAHSRSTLTRRPPRNERRKLESRPGPG